jgi:hypothetical protein
MGVNDISEKLGTYVRDNKIIIIIGLVFLLVFGSYSLGSNNNPEYKNLWQEAKSKNEKLDKQKIELIKENERLKSDQKGGISISEEKEGLKKWEEDVTRREISVTQREDDLKKEYKEYYETIGITKEEVGAAREVLNQMREAVENIGRQLQAEAKRAQQAQAMAQQQGQGQAVDPKLAVQMQKAALESKIKMSQAQVDQQIKLADAQQKMAIRDAEAAQRIREKSLA